MYKFDREKYDKRMQWFTHDRFGMFIHWGLYAIPARGEWVRSTEEIPEEDYIPFFNEFNPKDFDPKKWARLAKQAATQHRTKREPCPRPMPCTKPAWSIMAAEALFLFIPIYLCAYLYA